jgi:hypothetical protein
VDAIEQNKAILRIGALAVEEVDAPWVDITLHYAALVTLATYMITVTKEDGTNEQVKPSAEIKERMFNLRGAMHEPGKGTWYSARFSITRPENLEVDFDYENPPDFPFEPDPRTYYQDLQEYPRKFEEAPEWLIKKAQSAIKLMHQERLEAEIHQDG